MSRYAPQNELVILRYFFCVADGWSSVICLCNSDRGIPVFFHGRGGGGTVDWHQPLAHPWRPSGDDRS